MRTSGVTDMLSSLFSTRDTVVAETCALCATSLMVAMCSSLLWFYNLSIPGTMPKSTIFTDFLLK